ncbi:hypothetical protein, partial [Bacillus nitratireducens]|uniref:hypothetical protein n=1 Tax=Bacillus nitratireducens TaxID=2026193 RepID=UPI001ABEF2AA
PAVQGAFLCCAGFESGQAWDTRVGVQLNISAIFQIYRSQLRIYRRLFQYIDASTRNIDLSTNYERKKERKGRIPRT